MTKNTQKHENIVKMRIKVKHLAEEARINRSEAKKLHGQARHSLNHHRQWDIRNEARATQLVYALQRGVPYSVVEPTVKDIGKRDFYIVPRVKKMAAKYPVPDMQAVEDWFAGKEHKVAGLHPVRDAESRISHQGSAEAVVYA